MEIKDNLIQYYDIVRSSLRVFDDIIVRLVLQGSTVVLAVVTASLLAYQQGYWVISLFLIASSIIFTLALLLKLWIYVDILGIGISSAIKIERKMFSDSQDDDLRFDSKNPENNISYRLTEYLKKSPDNLLGGIRSVPTLVE